MPTYFQRLSDPIFLSRVRPKTLAVYKTALQPFTDWALAQNLSLVDPPEWDDALLEFRYAHPKLTKSKFQTLIAALEFFVPTLRRKLDWSHTMVSAWARAMPVRHTVALTSKPGRLLAIHFVVRGWPRLALGMLVQIATGLRPNEMLQLLSDHVILPEEQDVISAVPTIMLVLGVRQGTKTRRMQMSTLPAGTHPLPEILANCKRATPPGMYMFPYTLSDYRLRLKEVQAHLGIDLGYTPHSPRAGFATEARLQGMSFEEIRENGRWLSDSSLRTYLDLVGATAGLRTLRARGMGPLLQAADEQWPHYFGIAA